MKTSKGVKSFPNVLNKSDVISFALGSLFGKQLA